MLRPTHLALTLAGAGVLCSSVIGSAGPDGARSRHSVPRTRRLVAKSVRLYSDRPGISFRRLKTPVSVEYLIAGMNARDARLKTARATTVVASYTFGPEADAIAAEHGEPDVGRRPGETEWSRVTCRWWVSGKKLAYRTMEMNGNAANVRILAQQAAAYDGRDYRSLDTYRIGGTRHAIIAPTPAAFAALYWLDPRSSGEVWLGPNETLMDQFRGMRREGFARVSVAGAERMFGARCYRVDVRFKDGGRWHLWLDADHDLLVRRDESVRPGHKQVVVGNVSRLLFSNGVWMTKSADQAQYALVRDGHYARIGVTTFNVSGFVANEPVPGSEFELPIPPGTQVDDVRNNARHVVPAAPTRHAWLTVEGLALLAGIPCAGAACLAWRSIAGRRAQAGERP